MQQVLVKRIIRKYGIVMHIRVLKPFGEYLFEEDGKRMVLGQAGDTDIACTEKYYYCNRKSIDSKTEILNGIQELQFARA